VRARDPERNPRGMPLARVYFYYQILAFWLVGYGEWLWRLVGGFAEEFLSEEEEQSPLLNQPLASHYPPLPPTMAMVMHIR